MIGKVRNKIFHFVYLTFVLWFFLLLCFYYSGSNSKIPKTSEDDRNAYSFHASHEDSVHKNSSLSDTSRVMTKDDNDTKFHGFDKFFVGGDWSTYINNELSLTNEESPSFDDFGERSDADEVKTNDPDVVKEPNDPCSGKYVYIHKLPSEFNDDLLKNCRSLSEWTNMCSFVSNQGLGPPLKDTAKALSNGGGWYETNQFMLEVIFHNRMKQYKCLTKDSSLASVIFVPYYAGLDVARFLWNSNTRSMKDYSSLRLMKWLHGRSEWNVMLGRDHFMVAGRITWDLRRLTDNDFDWGNRLMLLPESKNMTMLTIESSPWNNNDFAIPYPTHFHPWTDQQVLQWQNVVRRSKRRFLFSFVGAPRPNLTKSIRQEIINQCMSNTRKCKFLECKTGSGNKCNKGSSVIKLFKNSLFCLQPPGDSYTRRSIFDSILSGCIPVFFHPGSAYVQYLWHLPKDYTKYSVFIPGNDIKQGNISIDRILSRFGRSKVTEMREQVIRLIPGVVYANPMKGDSGLMNFEDAFDITIDRVIDRVAKIRTKSREGNSIANDDDIEELNWRKSLFGNVEKHEWDPYFERGSTNNFVDC